MTKTGNNLADKLTSTARRHKIKLLSAGVLFVVYTLAGFYFVPWLVEKIATDSVRDTYGVELSIDRVAFNPFTLSLEIDGLAMPDPDGTPFASVEHILVNLQLSSLFRFAATFAEVRLDTPEVFLARDNNGGMNTSFLAASNDTQAAPETEASGMPRVIVQQFTINEAALHWDDAVPPQPVATTLGPVNVSVQNLNTLPQREGQQEVVITTETTGTLSWSGSLQLNPLNSVGRASVKGSHMPLMSAYIRDQFGFEIVQGEADVSLDYAVSSEPGSDLTAAIDNFNFSLDDVLVRTYGATTPAGEPNDRDVLAVPRFSIVGAALRWPEQTIAVEEIVLADTVLSIYRGADGELNIVPKSDPADEADEPAQATDDSGWLVELDRFAVENMSIGLVDESVEPAGDLGINNLQLTIEDITTEPGARFPTEASIDGRNGGDIQVAGQIGVLPEPVVELDLVASRLAVAVVHPYIKPLADVNLDTGLLGIDAELTSGPDDVLAFAGDVSITDFLITETDEGSRLGSWDALIFERVDFSLDDSTLEISEVRFERPYADVFVAEDGSVNLGRIAPGEQVPVDDGEESKAENPPVEASDDQATGSEFDVTVGRVVVVDAAADFADFSLPLPFEAGIAELNGELTTIATNSAEPSEVSMEGKVDEYGLLRVTGSLTPLEVARNTDINLRFQNVEIPKFSAYTIAFAGREIASGKLDLDLGYVLQEGELAGENKIVMRDFVLGEKVEHPDAMSLPLGLAVGLLKGPDGTIDIDLPVRGNVDDPEFSYGRVVGEALVNLVLKIVASPFNLLANLVGVEAEELDHISFFAGRSDLTPPEEERIAKLAEALSLRPELVLEVRAVIDPEADGLAIRETALDELIESQIEATDDDSADDAMYAEQRADVIEDLYVEAGMSTDELKVRFTAETTDPESGRTTSEFDSLAFTAEMRRLLVERQTVTQEELLELAESRAESVRTAIVAVDGTLAERIQSGEMAEVEAEDDGSIRMDAALSSGDG
jgi:uncharacterized protein involved in outer membrane biogenesis